MSEENTTPAENVVPQTKADLPQWAQDELTEARSEAAKYRTQKNEAVEKAKEEVAASFKDKVAELEAQIHERDAEVKGSRTEVAQIKAALSVGIDADRVLNFAELLKGESPEELASHAEQLKELFTNGDSQKSTPDKAVDPSQGSSSVLPLNGDPLLQALTRAVNR